MEADVSYLAGVTGVPGRAGAHLHAVRDAAAALAAGGLQPDLPERQPLRLREVQGPDVQAIQPGQEGQQLFPGHQLATAGVPEAALHIKGYKMSTAPPRTSTGTKQAQRCSCLKEQLQRRPEDRKREKTPWNRLA